MGYFSDHIPKDHKEAQEKAKKIREALERFAKHGSLNPDEKEVLSGPKYLPESLKETEKKKDIAKKMPKVEKFGKGKMTGYFKGETHKLKKLMRDPFKPNKHPEGKKGRQSLNTPKGEHNEGEKNYLGKNEENRP